MSLQIRHVCQNVTIREPLKGVPQNLVLENLL
jgi:hypothetical protein